MSWPRPASLRMVHRSPSENFSQEALNAEKSLLALVGLVVVGFASAGWYLGWYKLGVDSHDPNHPKINVEVETNKIKQDVQKEVKAVGTAFQTVPSQPIVPSELPVLPPPPPPQFNAGETVPPVTIPLPPPPSLPPIK